MSSNDYEVIEAPFTYSLDDGETFENKLIDFGDRENVTITAKGTNWTIRNIGFKGTIPYNETIFGVCDSGGGTSTMENIYFGEATGEQPASERSICIWTDPSHSGHMDVRNVNFNVPGNNGIYGSAPAYNGDGGTIALEGCYGNDCHHTAFRVGDNGMSITDCCAYKSGQRSANRGIWVWEGNYSGAATIENVDLITNGTGQGLVDNGSPTIEMSNVRTDDGTGTHSNPEHRVPDGCPQTAIAAARGGSGGGTGDGSSPGYGDDYGDDYGGDDGSGSDGGSGEEPAPEPDPWADDENYVEGAKKADWNTRITANYEEGEGSYAVWSTEPIKQAYWAAVTAYNSDIKFGSETIDGTEYFYADGVANGQLDGLVTNGELVALEALGDNYTFWMNGSELDPSEYPNMPGQDAPDDGSSGSNDYEVINAKGQTISLGDGDVWENKLVDLTTGSGFLLHITGEATVRNVGFKGLYRGDNFLASISAPSGTVVFENVYAGDGGAKVGTDFVHGAGGFFYHKNAGCNVEFNNCHTAGFPNNGWYCSNSPDGGTISWTNCFGKNNGVSTFRCGGEGDLISNCVAYNDETDYGEAYDTSWVEASGRPFWVWPGGHVQIEDSNFAAGNYPYAGVMRSGSSASMHGGALEGSVNNGNLLTRNNVGSSADLTPPEGVPMSPEEAASGGDDAAEPKPPEEPEPPTAEERIAMLEQKNKQLKEQIADYEAAFEEMEEMVKAGEKNAPLFGGMWKALKKAIPTTGDGK